ncbi:conserved hypothetical protein [Paraburkholderia piptadeniae]|uniref:Putative DNA-binding domain-containing protein n=1 Tax=Paraburkholderia piptadeniae TaxID=1701573 RepID=A0A1N7SWF1_9BURK|nr:DNA-binding domain-containing protein [Paraburkholderia piptadeniae]SIT51673.1 conserved hypothetical protein [Paraburkholderia piptadeniae]
MKTPFVDLERAFADAIHDPREEIALLEQLATGRSVAASRLAIYRGNVQSHWHAALANTYPVLLALAGAAYFARLARAYANACPSDSGDLNRYGAHLPAFIGNWERDSRYEYFGDIARLEWAVHTAWYADDPNALSAQQWRQIGSEKLLASRLATHPACSVVHSRYAIADIWRGHQPGGTFPRSIDAPAWALVVRPRWRPFVIDQDRGGHAAFIALQRGHTLNEATDIALDVDAQFDIASQLQSWIMVCAVTGLVT